MLKLYLHAPEYLTIGLQSRDDFVMPAAHNERLLKMRLLLKFQYFDVYYIKLEYIG